MKNLKKLAVVAVGAAVSSGAFAQASGVDVTPVVSIGGAVLAVVVVAWGYKVVKGFLGR
ncbi:coat protein [Burkholderia multivorans]|uniref:major capsid protein n=1 Tax=Burkholderia multivorans TaxID=87883 RepID=UPI00075B791F|nr:major capsid protein [Burkholderia multivorans]KWF67375.1 coat protein [Burkholderia multivorans]KWF83742.1 coat protein [Burkholderia multivorans]